MAAHPFTNYRYDRASCLDCSGFRWQVKSLRRILGPAPKETLMNRIGRAIEMIISQSRWLIVPFLVGLVVGLAALAYAFVSKALPPF